MPSTPLQSYLPSRRHWVKLWVKEWLTGTIRFELTPTQRGIFVDLLVLAGNSRTPGIISPGMNGKTPLGYPISWLAGTLVCPEQELVDTITACEAQDRIKVNKAPDGSLIITLVNWSKYQSEYLRQAQYKQKKVVTPDVIDDVNLPAKSATAVPFPLKRLRGKEVKRKEEESPLSPPKGESNSSQVHSFVEKPIADLLACFTPKELDELKQRFPNINLPWEAIKCLEWWQSKHRQIKSPKVALKNWLEKAKPGGPHDHYLPSGREISPPPRRPGPFANYGVSFGETPNPPNPT